MKVLFTIGKQAVDIKEGEILRDVDNKYVKMKVYNPDGTWSFHWYNKLQIVILKDLDAPETTLAEVN